MSAKTPDSGLGARLLLLALVLLLSGLQYQLWLGPGGLIAYMELRAERNAQIEENQRLKDRNDALAAEVADLKDEKGDLEAVEERARSEMGLIKRDEIFYQVIERPPRQPGPR
ncbi:MAG: cell division protein FtsB [Gammaproteobacteria bacterium]